jgi:hypothetical protein
VFQLLHRPPYCHSLLLDSRRAISIAHDLVKHGLTKHICVDASFVRPVVQDQILALSMCLSSYSWQISSGRPRLERNMGFFSPNSVL